MDHGLIPAETVRFRILGPFQLSVAGNVVPLDQPKPRAVLAMLVLSPNAVVSPGRLIDDLWEHHPPASAANTLQTYVHRLRSRLPPDTLITRAGGYELAIDPACIDAIEFERRAESPAARAPNARLRADALGAALALWRGEALEDLAHSVWALPEIARLEAARLDALERRIEAELELGHAHATLRELEVLVRRHPFRERLSALLMLALYRDGRQAEALRAFERLRRNLADEMGIEPSAQLAQLEREILFQDARLDLPARTGQFSVPLSARLAATASSPFVGRPRELEAIDRAFDDTVAGNRSTVLISGEPGIGKSALAAGFARAAVERGAVVLYGHSDSDLAIPFQPWTEALAPLVAHAPQELLDEHLSVHGAVLARLVPQLVERATGELETGDDVGPQRLFGAVADLLERVAAVSPVVIVLDDLHWADRATTELLQFLVALDRSIRVMFVATLRESEVDSKHVLFGVLAAFVRLPAVYRAPLGGLNDEELLELVNVTAAPPDADRSVALRDALMHETDGNPFFAIEILRHWHDAGAVGEDSSLRVHGVPIGVRHVIDDRVARLGDETEQLLAIAAVIGRDFDLEILGAVTGLDVDVLTARCERSVDASVLVRTDKPWSYSFAHALIEHSIYDGLAPTPRAGLHLRIVRALEALHHDDLLPYAGALAHHWICASVRESGEQALKYATWAGDNAMSMLAPSDAVSWYRQALDLLDGQVRVDDRSRCALLVALGRAQAVGGDYEARATLIEAGALARRLGATDLLIGVALATRRGDFNQAAGEDVELTALTLAALDAVGDAVTPERARLLAALMEHTAGRDWELARERAVAAVDAARQLGDDQLLMEAITTTYVARAQPETLPQRLADTDLAVSIADERRNPLDRFATRFTRYVAVMESGEVSEADRLLDEMEHIAAAAALTLPHTQFQLLMTRAGRRILAGDHAGAAQAANALFELNSANVPEATTTGGALLSLIGYEQGRVAEMIDGFTAAVEQNPDFAVLRAAVANYYGDLGRLDEAGAILDAERTADFRAIPYDINWTTSMTLYGDCAVALGDRAAAATIRDRLVPFGSAIAFNGLTSSGALGRVLGRLDTLLGDYADADRALGRALDLNTAMRAPFWIARTQLDYADLLLLQSPDDRRAPELARAAESTAVRYGFAGLEHRAGELLAQLASVGGAG